MGRHALRVAALATLALVAAGCANRQTPQTVTCALPDAPKSAGGPALVSQPYGLQASPIPLQAVLYTNEVLARQVATQAMFSSRTEGGTVQVNVRWINCTDSPMIVRARTSFLAKGGAPAEAPTAWQNVSLPPKATGLYGEKSLGREGIEAYLIEVALLP